LARRFFQRHILLLDFVAERLAILGKGVDLPFEYEKQAAFVPL
jgi:hypothetical protein